MSKSTLYIQLCVSTHEQSCRIYTHIWKMHIWKIALRGDVIILLLILVFKSTADLWTISKMGATVEKALHSLSQILSDE